MKTDITGKPYSPVRWFEVPNPVPHTMCFLAQEGKYVILQYWDARSNSWETVPAEGIK